MQMPSVRQSAQMLKSDAIIPAGWDIRNALISVKINTRNVKRVASQHQEDFFVGMRAYWKSGIRAILINLEPMDKRCKLHVKLLDADT